MHFHWRAVFILAMMFVANSLRADDSSSIPFVPLKVLITLNQDSKNPREPQAPLLKAFNWKWMTHSHPKLDAALLETIQADLVKTKNDYAENLKHFDLPGEIDCSGANPATGLEYIVVVPKGADGSVDLNITYVYNPTWKEFIFKTCVFPSQ